MSPTVLVQVCTDVLTTAQGGNNRRQSDISGTIQIHFENSTMYDKWLDETPSSIAICITDLDGNKYVLDFPQVRFTTGERTVTGPNGDVMANLGWTAYEDATEECQMTITRWDA